MVTIYHILGWLLFGLIIGAIARFLVRGKQPMSLLMTAPLGIVGSLLGGGISWLIWGNLEGNYNPTGWVMSIVGAIIVVLIYARMTTARGAG
jgi:uncharacterized membrane protein YeaQ/YmgE (transglycosylase-associated protein family)